MKGLKVWYEIQRFDKKWTVWKYKEGEHSYGSLGLYTSSNKNDCLDYCKKNKIELGKRRAKYV